MKEPRTSILVSDPDDAAASALASRFSDESYAIRWVGTAFEAIAFVQQGTADVLVLDSACEEPRIEAAVSIVKGIDEDLPVIVTARENSLELERGIRRANVFYYHLKSFGAFELELAVRNALEQRRKTPRR